LYINSGKYQRVTDKIYSALWREFGEGLKIEVLDSRLRGNDE